MLTTVDKVSPSAVMQHRRRVFLSCPHKAETSNYSCMVQESVRSSSKHKESDRASCSQTFHEEVEAASETHDPCKKTAQHEAHGAS